MSELFPTKNIAIEVVGCTDPTKIWAFNYWHDKVLIPELKKIRGIPNVYRYRDTLIDWGEHNANWSTPAGAPTRYLNVYRIDWPDPWAIMQQVKEFNAKKAKEDKIDFLQVFELTVWDFCYYHRSIRPQLRETHLPDGMPEAVLLVTNSSVVGKEIDHDDWWLNTHSHDLMEIPGYVQCSRFHNLNPNRPENEANTLNVYEIDTDDVRASCMKNFTEDRSVRQPQGRFSGFTHRGPNTYCRGVYEHWDPM